MMIGRFRAPSGGFIPPGAAFDDTSCIRYRPTPGTIQNARGRAHSLVMRVDAAAIGHLATLSIIWISMRWRVSRACFSLKLSKSIFSTMFSLSTLLLGALSGPIPQNSLSIYFTFQY